MAETVDTVKIFCLMGAAGLAVGFLFDVFRAVHMSFRGAGERFGRISVQVTDAVFVLTSFCIFTLGVYVFNGGEVRSYCVLGCAAGVCAYFLALAPVINRMLRLIFKMLFIIVKNVKKLFTKVL